MYIHGKHISWGVVFSLLIFAPSINPENAKALETSPAPVLLENFEEAPSFAFPVDWKIRGDARQARSIYQVMSENGNQFLHARAESQAIQIGLEHAYSPGVLPMLSWRWRVRQLPPGADERRRETHDSAAGVYVIFDNTILPRVIKYVWSTTAPAGTRAQNPLYWRAKIVVLESGATALGQWRQEKVNVYADYKQLFDAEPGQVQAIGLMTSSSFTKSLAIADYDDFCLYPSWENHCAFVDSNGS